MRTKKTTKNLITSLILTTLVALIGVAKIKVFLLFLGNEKTGIYQLFSQIFSYISLIDAGLTGSILYSLYKPVSKDDTKKINSILKGGRNFYNKIAVVITIIGLILSFKIDFFLSDYTTPLWYIQICFILFIISNAINYMVTSQKVILEARQNLYKVHLVVYILIIIRGLGEMLLLCLHLDLLSLMLLFLLCSIVQNIFIIYICKKDYKEFTYKDVKPDYEFKKESKNLIVQKIAYIIFNNIDVVLISKYISSASVVIYTSYSYIVNSLQTIVKKIGSASLASVGNLLVEDSKKSKDFFKEFNSMCFYLANLICIPLLVVITPFVSIFYGDSYTLPYLGSFCVVMILYFKTIEIPLEVYTSALGYFGKIKKCIIFQSMVNLVLSFVLLFKIGISGVLLATVISYIVGEFIMYPIILNKNYFKNNKINYHLDLFILAIIGVFSYGILILVTHQFAVNNLIQWFFLGVICFIINFIIVTIYFKIIKQDKFITRGLNLIKERRKKYEE